MQIHPHEHAMSHLPTGCGFLADQLRRASASVVLTFAEGYDKGSRAEQHRFLHMSRGSAQEVAAIFDVAQRLGAIAPDQHARGKELCDHIVRMLFRFRASPGGSFCSRRVRTAEPDDLQ